jgi:hypothetical protein
MLSRLSLSDSTIFHGKRELIQTLVNEKNENDKRFQSLPKAIESVQLFEKEPIFDQIIGTPISTSTLVIF